MQLIGIFYPSVTLGDSDMTTSTMEMRTAIGNYVETHSPVELPAETDEALELGRLAGHPIGSEPELGHVTIQALYLLKDEGVITTTEKENTRLVEYVAPFDATEVESRGYNATDLFGASDALWDEAAALNQKLLAEENPAASAIRQELNAIYDQLGEIFNRP